MWLVIIIGVIAAIYLFGLWMDGSKFTKIVSAKNKVVIVTGCNTGIGKHTVYELALRGAKIYMACRDNERCEMARQEIIKKTQNTNVFNCHLDLASLDSIREFVQKFLKMEKRLDILINNAGVFCVDRTVTKDGFEMTIGVNHLGPFLLTNLLLDTLKSSAPSRIVNVSSFTHRFIDNIDKKDLNNENAYHKWKAYTRSKLANILFTRELAKRLCGTGVTANSLHPGNIATDIARNELFYRIFYHIVKLFLKSIKAGAQTTLAVALDPDFEKITGKYFRECKISTESKAAQNDDMAEWLWNISEWWTGLKN